MHGDDPQQVFDLGRQGVRTGRPSPPRMLPVSSFFQGGDGGESAERIERSVSIGPGMSNRRADRDLRRPILLLPLCRARPRHGLTAQEVLIRARRPPREHAQIVFRPVGCRHLNIASWLASVNWR